MSRAATITERNRKADGWPNGYVKIQASLYAKFAPWSQGPPWDHTNPRLPPRSWFPALSGPPFLFVSICSLLFLPAPKICRNLFRIAGISARFSTRFAIGNRVALVLRGSA